MSPAITTTQIKNFSRIAALCVLTLAALVTILGKGGGGEPPANPAPRVTSMTPFADQTGNTAVATIDVARDTMVTATFSEAMNAGTIDTSSFTLRNAQGALIPAAVTYNMNTNTATLTPNQPLVLLAPHTVRLSTAITDQEGAALTGPVTWNFRTEDGDIGNPVPVSMSIDGLATNPQIAVNAKGDALAVWSQAPAGGMGVNSIYANSYTVANGWGMFPALLEQDLTGQANSPHVAINENGAGFAVWQQNDGGQVNVYANRFTPGGGFGGWEFMATKIGFDPTDANGPARAARVAVDSAGNAVAAWEQEGPDNAATGTVTSIWANIYTAGAGWAANQVLLETDDTGNASSVRIASSTDAGVISQAVAVWEQRVGPTLGVWSNRFIQGVGWDPVSAQIDTSTNGARRPELAMNAEGDALAVWEQNPLGTQEIWSNSFEPGATGSGWETPRKVSGTTGTVNDEDPEIAINADGDALAVWLNAGTIWFNRYDDGSWNSFADTGVGSQAGGARNVRIAIDANSNGLAVWEQDTGTRTSIYGNRWIGGDSGIFINAPGVFEWGTEGPIDANGGLSSSNPQIGVDAEGRALSIWERGEAAGSSIWGNRLE